jgi:hypothetical protein
MTLIIVQSSIQEGREELGKALIDVLAARGYDASACAVIFQRQDISVFTVDTGYIAPEAVAPVRFAGRQGSTGTPGYDKNDLREKVLGILKQIKDVSMTDVAYRLKISNEPWAGRALRELFTELEQQGLLTKVGEKRGTRYILKEDESVGIE